MIDVKRIAESIPENPEEYGDYLVHIQKLGAEGFGTQLPAYVTTEHHGCFKLRRAFKILQEIKKQGGRNFYLGC